MESLFFSSFYPYLLSNVYFFAIFAVANRYDMEIQIEQLQKCYGPNTVVDIPSFCVKEGEILGLVGNNGAGKTTLFRLMLDLVRADGGHVHYLPKSDSDTQESSAPIDPSQSEEWKSMTGAYIDDGFLIDFLTPDEYFAFVGRISGLSAETVNERLAAFETFSGGEIFGKTKYIRDLSAGNKQKVGIIAALINRPQLVILDEPFNFLDPSSQHILKKLLVDYNREMGATILVSSHNLQHTVDISTRVALLEHGRIIKDMANVGGICERELEHYFETVC